MLFDDLGIYGWDSVEPIIMTALLADLPILLIGDIGTNKTEGAKTIAEGALGRPIEFRHYEVPTLNFDDLIGFLNPKTLTNGTLKFIPTPISIWKAEGVLFDEINRANPFIQSKLHEVVRTRKVMGLPTDIKVVFAAVNPPGTYQTGYMDLAIASRFVSVQVPNIKAMKDAEVDRIIGKNGGPKVQPKTIHDALDKARGTKFARKDMQKTSDLVKRVARDLAETDIIFNPRQLRMMFKMVMAGEALNRTIGTSPFSGTEVNSGLYRIGHPGNSGDSQVESRSGNGHGGHQDGRRRVFLGRPDHYRQLPRSLVSGRNRRPFGLGDGDEEID